MEPVSTAEAISVSQSPFRLFKPFSENDIDTFFGRDDEIDLVYQYIHESNVLLIYGVSGTGKSSLVQCGLLNMVKHFNWTNLVIRRGEDINSSLISLLQKHVKLEYMKDDAAGLLQEIFLNNFQSILLVFDQFEELFVLGNEAERKEFLQNIKEIMKMTIPWKMIFVMREDQLGGLNEFEEGIPNYLKNRTPEEKKEMGFEEGLPNLFKKRLRVDLMSRPMCREVIIKSCERFNIAIENTKTEDSQQDVPDRILQAVAKDAEAIHLPRLQAYLDRLWKEAEINKDGRKFFDDDLVKKVEALEASRGDVLRLLLEEKIKGQTEITEKDAWKLLKLFVPEKGVTRRKVKLSEYTALPVAALEAAVNYFVRENILCNCPDDLYELAHESLVPAIQNEKLTRFRTRLENPTIEGNPYRGLKSFDTGDSNKFYGRKEAIKAVYEKTEKNTLVVIVGNSGAGKSSLIKAGLFPKLKDDGYKPLPIIKAGDRPLHCLDEALQVIKSEKQDRKFILLVDQYEELITRIDSKEIRQEFITRLHKLIRDQENGVADFKLKVLITVRADFEPQFSVMEPLAPLWRKGKYIIPPFSKEEIIEVIEEPAYQAGLEFSPPSLVDTIAEEVYSSQATGLLPLMSFILSELYSAYSDRYRKSGVKDGLLLEEDYNAMGGVIGGLQTRADHIYYQFKHKYPQEHKMYQDTMRNIILRMVYMSTGELAGQRVYEDDLVFEDENINRITQTVMDILVKSSLIISATDNKGKVFYEPAHDVLVKTWGQIWDWIGKVGKDTLYVKARLKDVVNEYSKTKDPALLWTNAWLDTLIAVKDSDNNWLNRKEIEFVHRSIEARDRMKNWQEEKRRIKEQNKRVYIGILTVVLAVVSILGWKAYRQSDDLAKQNVLLREKTEEARQLQAKAITAAEAAKAQQRRAELALSEAELAAEKAAYEETRAIALLNEKNREVAMKQAAIELSDRRRDSLNNQVTITMMALARVDSARQAADATNQRLLAAYDSLEASQKALNVQKVQNTAQVLGLAKTLRLKDAVIAYRVAELAHKNDTANKEAAQFYNQVRNNSAYYYTNRFTGSFSTISPTGEYMLIFSPATQQIVLRNSSTLQATDSIHAKSDVVITRFTPDGKYILTAYGNEVEILNTTKLKDKINIKIKGNDLIDARLSNDNEGSKTLVISREKLRVYNTYSKSDSPLFEVTLGRNGEAIADAVFSEDNTKIIGRTVSGNIFIANALIGRMTSAARITNQHRDIERSFISPKGNCFITATQNTAMLYTNGGEQRTELRRLTRQYGPLYSANFSTDGRKAVLSFAKSRFVLIDVNSPDNDEIELDELGYRSYSLPTETPNIVISGNTLLYAQDNGLVKCLNLQTRKLEPLASHEGKINSMGVFRNGALILTSSNDNNTLVWNYDSPAALEARNALPQLTDDHLKKLGLGKQ